MPYYINKRAKQSKTFAISIKAEWLYVHSKKDSSNTVTFLLPTFVVQENSSNNANFLKKALEFARKNIIEK